MQHNEEFPKWIRLDEGLDLRLLGTCPEVPVPKVPWVPWPPNLGLIWRKKIMGRQPIYPDSGYL